MGRPESGRDRGEGAGILPLAISPWEELGRLSDSWGGILGTSFWVDPKERLIGVMMIQRYPHPDRLDEVFQTLAYQAVLE